MHVTLFAALRAAHILIAALWLGAGCTLAMHVMPAVRTAGLASDPFLMQLTQRRLGRFMAVIGGLTVLSGLWLYWIFTKGLRGEMVSSAPGLALAIGGLCGLIAAVVGGAVLGRSVEGITVSLHAAAHLPEGVEQSTHLREVERLQRRFARFSKIDLTLLVAALLLMALSHYA